jgi:predicted phosphodiesterase
MFAWSHGHVAALGHLAWLASLPLEERLSLPDGTRVLLVHAAPGADGYDGQRDRTVTPARSDDELRRLVAGCEADLVFVGHTHVPIDRSVDGVRVVNTGSVSNPWAPDLRASYVVLDATPDAYQIEHRRVSYDVGGVLRALRESGHPTYELIARNFRGERYPPWES